MKAARTSLFALCLSALLLPLLTAPAVAQEPSPEEAAAMEAMMKAATPGEPHAELAKKAGTWKVTMTMWGAPDAPPQTATGTAKLEMTMGGRVLVETFDMELMGMPFEGVGHTGYDNVTGKYWGTWFDNMSTGVTVLEGTLDSMEGISPDPQSGGKIPMRIDMRQEDGKEVNEFYMGTPDGEMVKTMEIVYSRE